MEEIKMNKTKKLLAVIAAMVMLGSCAAKESEEQKAEDTASAASTVQEETASQAADGESAAKDSEPTAAEDIDYIVFARELCTQVFEGNYSELTKLFSEEMANVISEDALRQTMAQIGGMAGEFKEIGATELQEDEEYVYTSTLACYENMNFNVLITFKKGSTEVEGFAIMPAQDDISAQDTDTYSETGIKIGEYGLDGMLTMPKGVEAPPVVVLIQGTGSTDMNENAGICKPFYDIAHDLADQGIASVRYNKRFCQFPEMGEEEGITIDDEVLGDADAAIKYAQSLVDSGEASKVYVLGHSLGGMLAPIIAERNSEVDGIISLAGTPRKLEVVLIEQLTAQLDQSEGQMKEYIEKFIEQMETYRDTGELVPNDNPTNLQAMFGVEYWNSLGAFEPAETADKLDIPMLFLQGDQDVQVYPDRDFTAWKETLEDNANCEFIMYEGLGHLFIDDTYHIDNRVTDDIARFIKE